MQYRTVGDKYIIQVAQGELVHATLHQFCTEQGIANAWVSALGAIDFVRCGYYDRDAREYRFTEYEAVYEVTSYTGNIMRKGTGLFVHAHATFSDTENTLFGGHVDEMRVGLVLEVCLTPLPSKIIRTFDDATGLYLMDLSE